MEMFFIQFIVPQLYWKFSNKRPLSISGVLEPFVVKDVFDVSFWYGCSDVLFWSRCLPTGFNFVPAYVFDVKLFLETWFHLPFFSENLWGRVGLRVSEYIFVFYDLLNMSPINWSVINEWNYSSYSQNDSYGLSTYVLVSDTTQKMNTG